jgi:hypothetical protein
MIADADTMTVAAMMTIVAETSGPSPRPRAKYRPAARWLPPSLASQPSRFAISGLSSGGARRSACWYASVAPRRSPARTRAAARFRQTR